ncbi:hypothetical protein MS3_00011024 [Schistosoma haematobium]|uniref:Uncharacterized protein n=1 Tax=Schistosoma haematobium TaxID=6185 RepID=A0A922IKS3_SCHHA|nr:hypothetical protein MS3_00011024 [Schistosoma haematobium]KAH9581158.1 hypothetical protein MS3_00011024 [Schistosoma haematobium]
MDIIYSWCIIWCLLNLNLNGKIGQAQEDNNTTMTSTTSDFNSTTDDTNYTTIPSYSSTDIITNDATNLKCQRIFYMIVGLISLMAIN